MTRAEIGLELKPVLAKKRHPFTCRKEGRRKRRPGSDQHKTYQERPKEKRKLFQEVGLLPQGFGARHRHAQNAPLGLQS